MVFAPSVISSKNKFANARYVHARTASYVQTRVVPEVWKGNINLLFPTGGDGIAANGDDDKISSFHRQYKCFEQYININILRFH